MTISQTLHALAKPLRKAALGAGFALLSVWFIASSVASIHFEEHVVPLWSDAAQAVTAKSTDFTRGFLKLSAVLR